MSAEENTRLVQSAYEAFGRGDMAALAEVMADDIEWVDPEAAANEGQSADVSGVDFNEIFALASGCAFAAVGLLASPSSAASCFTCTARGARLGSE